MPGRKYEFHWGLLGDLTRGRPNLGPMTRVEVYRLFQYALRDVLESRFGTAEADRVIYEAGHLAGRCLYENVLGGETDWGKLLRLLQQVMRDFSVGVLRVEHADAESGDLTVTVSEDLDCSGLPDTGDVVCKYDEGLLAGILESATGRRYDVREIDCWCTGDRTCRFSGHPLAEETDSQSRKADDDVRG